jgi:hypothetical protein
MTSTEPEPATEVAPQAQDARAPMLALGPVSPLGNRAVAALVARGGRAIPPPAAVAGAVAPVAASAGNRATARLVARLATAQVAVQRQAVCDPAVSTCVDKDSEDYKAGYRDAATTGVKAAAPRFGAALDDYDAGFAAGMARSSSPPPPVASTPPAAAPLVPNAGSADYKAGYDDATVGSGEPSPGSRSGQARVDYSAGYAAGLKVAQQQGGTQPAPAPAPADKTASLPLTERVKKVIEYAKFGDQFAEQIKELLSPEALAVMAAFIGAQFVGIGEAADALGTVMLAFKIGADAVTVAQDLAVCFQKTFLATTDADLREAGRRLAHAVSLASIDILLVYVTTKSAKGKPGEGEGTGKGPGKGEGEGKGTGEGEGEGARGKDERGKDERGGGEPVEGPAEGITAEDVHLDDLKEDPAPANDPEVTPAICFPAGTLVHGPNGSRPIEAITVGELVLAWDEESQAVTPRRVTDVIRGATGTWVDVDLVCGGSVRSTPAHRFWVESSGGWLGAGELAPGMTVRLVDGSTAEVSATRDVAVDSETTFNLSVEDLETFFVGGVGVLVHNIKRARFTRLNRGGYRNYVLRSGGPRGPVYYSGMFGPNDTPAGVARRHAANRNRFDPSKDFMEIQEGTRTYGEARVVENDLAKANKTVIGRDGENYRGNRQQPLADDKLTEYKEFLDIKAQGHCG